MEKSETTVEPTGNRRAKPGQRFGGRVKGTPNKLTQTVKQAIESVAEGLGGAEGMKKWANAGPENTKIFWSQIYPRLLPRELKAEHSGSIETSAVLVVPQTLTAEEWFQTDAPCNASTGASAASNTSVCF